MRELKAHISRYLDRAESGEMIEVTDRGRPKAILGPLQKPSQPTAPPWGLTPTQQAALDRRIKRGIREGWIKEGNGAPPVLHRRRFKGSMTVQQMMDEDRGD